MEVRQHESVEVQLDSQPSTHPSCGCHPSFKSAVTEAVTGAVTGASVMIGTGASVGAGVVTGASAMMATGAAVGLSGEEQGNTCINVLDVDEEGVWTPQIIDDVEHIKS